MAQRPPMPPFMRAFVTFIVIAFTLTLVLTRVQAAHLISHRLWMACFYVSGALAGFAAWRVSKMPA